MERTERAEQKRSVFVEFARGLASLSTCRRRQVGCMISDPTMQEVYAIGFNGPPRGCSHDRCNAVAGAGNCGCIHAEANAIAKLSSKEPNLWLHCTMSPCMQCAGLIVNRGNILTVSYDSVYRDTEGINLLMEAGLNVHLF